MQIELARLMHGVPLWRALAVSIRKHVVGYTQTAVYTWMWCTKHQGPRCAAAKACRRAGTLATARERCHACDPCCAVVVVARGCWARMYAQVVGRLLVSTSANEQEAQREGLRRSSTDLSTESAVSSLPNSVPPSPHLGAAGAAAAVDKPHDSKKWVAGHRRWVLGWPAGRGKGAAGKPGGLPAGPVELWVCASCGLCRRVSRGCAVVYKPTRVPGGSLVGKGRCIPLPADHSQPTSYSRPLTADPRQCYSTPGVCMQMRAPFPHPPSTTPSQLRPADTPPPCTAALPPAPPHPRRPAAGAVAAAGGGHMAKWRAAVDLAINKSDPWASRRLHLLPMEHAVRHRYNPRTRKWVMDDGGCTGHGVVVGGGREGWVSGRLHTIHSGGSARVGADHVGGTTPTHRHP